MPILSPLLEKAQTYLGNALLKRSGVKQDYTSEQLKELARCSKDIVYFIENYCRIISLDEGEVPFHLYGYQKKMVGNMQADRFTLFMLSRQLGKTQTAAAFLLHQVIFKSHFTIAILANKDSAARETLSRIQFMYELLPSWLQLGVVTWNKGDIALDNHSKIFTAATSPSAIRGKAVNLLYLDEFAHVERDVEFWTSTFPTISSGFTTKVVITSTPKGLNLFYKLWKEAEEKKNPFKAYFYPWTEHPKRNAKWEKEQLQALGVLKFKQEVSCQFLGSSGTLIQGDRLQKMAFAQPVMQEEDDSFVVYAMPVPGRKYVMTVDTSEGVDADYSAISVFDVTEKPFRQVARFRSNSIPPAVFTEVVNRVGRKYNEAVAVVETNSMGKEVARDLWFEFEYENVIKSVAKERGAQVSYGHGSQLGVKTTKATKRLGCSTLKSLVETSLLIVEDYATINELGTFVSQGSSWGAEQGKTDDLVMTLVIFAWFTQQTAFEEFQNGSMNEMLRKAYDAERQGMPTMFFDDGTEREDEEVKEDLSLVAPRQGLF